MKVVTTNQPTVEFEANRAEVQSLRRLGILHKVDGVIVEGGELPEPEEAEVAETSTPPKSKNRHRAGSTQNQESPDSEASQDVTKSEED